MPEWHFPVLSVELQAETGARMAEGNICLGSPLSAVDIHMPIRAECLMPLMQLF